MLADNFLHFLDSLPNGLELLVGAAGDQLANGEPDACIALLDAALEAELPAEPEDLRNDLMKAKDQALHGSAEEGIAILETCGAEGIPFVRRKARRRTRRAGARQSQSGISPLGDHARTILPVEHSSVGIRTDFNGPLPQGVEASFDWWNDRLQVLVHEAPHDDAALHVRFDMDGSIAEILVRDDLMAKVKIESSETTTWQKERDRE